MGVTLLSPKSEGHKTIRRCKNKWQRQSGNYRGGIYPQAELGEEATAALVAKFKAMAEARGTVAEVDEWGKRRLAYPIDDLNEGYYVFMTFTADAAFPAELDRVMRITDGVMRSMIVCKDE